MSLFKCSSCGCVENTALSFYWIRPKDAPALCSACDPDLNDWHGLFPQEPADDKYVVDEDGFLQRRTT